MRKTIGSLLVRLGMDAKDVDKGLKQLSTNLKNFQRQAEIVGRSMTVGFTVPFALGMGKAIKAASDAEETFSKFSVVFSKVSGDAERSFSILRNQYGLSSKSAKELLSNTGDLLTGFGFSQAAALDLSTQVNKLAVDLASFTNYSGGAKGASEALTKALLGEREQLKGLGIAILESDVKRQMEIDRSKGLTFATERQAKAYATLQIAMTQSKNAQGDYARTQDSFANQSRLLKERVDDLAVSFGQAALPAANKFIKSLQGIVEKFQALSPATKELVIKVGAFVALAGPFLLLTTNIIKATKAMWELVAASKALATSGLGKLGLYGAAAYAGKELGEFTGSKIFGGKVVGGIGWVPNKPKGQMSSMVNQNLGLIPGMPSAQNSGFLAPPKQVETMANAGAVALNNYAGAAQRALQWTSKLLTPNRGNPAAGMASITPNLSPAMAGSVGGGLTPLAGVGGHGNAIAGMMAIQPDMQPLIEQHEASVRALSESYGMLGNAVSAAFTSIAESLLEGGEAFQAFGKAALLAGAQVVKAMLAATLAKAVAQEAGTKGVLGIIIGATAGLAAIGIVEGMISKMKTPKLAMGGVTSGPAIATIGDNQSGKEMILPLERSGMFADAIAKRMGGGGGQVVGLAVRGDDLIPYIARAQDRAIRRGSGNVIRF